MENANKLRITFVLSLFVLTLRVLAWQINNVAAWLFMTAWGLSCFVLLVWLVAYGYWVWEQKQEGREMDERRWYPFFVGVLTYLISFLMEIPIITDELQE